MLEIFIFHTEADILAFPALLCYALQHY